MRVANVDGRCKLVAGETQVDLQRASGSRFGPSMDEALERFDEVRKWWSKATSEGDEPWDPTRAGPPVPSPRQVFAVALNYRDHAAESGLSAPSHPVIFTKYPSSIAGSKACVTLPDGLVDWEVELVAVMGRTGRDVPKSAAWDFVAGLTVGQDLSERQSQLSGPAPQFSLAKSFAGFSPIGPALVSPDELDTPDDLDLGCDLNGEEMQKGRTSDMIFSVPEVIAYLSTIVSLYPGDLLFTGTPAGVGMGRTPPRFLAAGDRLRSWVFGIGQIEQEFVSRH